ncbi:PAS domain S-box protein [Candidatus Nitrospira bockiana]
MGDANMKVKNEGAVEVSGRDVHPEKDASIYEHIFHFSSDGIGILDAQGYYVQQNRAHAALLGYSSEELSHERPSVHMGEEQFAAVIAALQRDGVYRGELLCRTKSGALRPIELSAFTLLNADGEIAGYVGIKRDITERKQHERELERRYEELHAVYELTKSLCASCPLEEIQRQAILAIQRVLKADRVSILLMDGTGRMTFRAWVGLSDGYRRAVEGHSPWSGPRRPEPISMADVEQEPGLGPLRDVLLAEGIRALAFIPLLSGDQLLGKFMIYFDQPHAFTAAELRDAQHIANYIAIGIQRRQSEEEIQKLNRALVDKVREYEDLVHALEQSKADLQDKVSELQQFEDVVIGRELKMMELEKELERLKRRAPAGPGR